MKKILTFNFLFLIFTVLGLFTPASARAQTQEWTGVCVYNAETYGEQYQVATIQGLQCLIANVLSVAISGIGLVGFLMFIYAGFKYLTAGTNTQNVESARKAITYSIIGLIVALSAYFIVALIANFTGIESLLNFKIPTSETTW